MAFPSVQARSNFPASSPAGASGVPFSEASLTTPPPPFEVGLIVPDVPAAFSHAVASGATAWAPPATKPWGQGVAYVRDLNGILVELCTRIAGPPPQPPPPPPVRLFWVDAFAMRVGAGNPAAVVVLPGADGLPWPSPAAMQRVAAENGLSETAFLRRRGGDRWGLRWFTPEQEVDLCGQ